MAPRDPRILSANNVGRTGSIRFRLATSSHSWPSFRPGQRKRRPRSVDAHWSDVSDTLDNRSFSSRPKWHPHQRSWRTTSHSLNDQALRLAEHPHVRSSPGSSCPGYAVAEVNQRSRIHLGHPIRGGTAPDHGLLFRAELFRSPYEKLRGTNTGGTSQSPQTIPSMTSAESPQHCV